MESERFDRVLQISVIETTGTALTYSLFLPIFPEPRRRNSMRRKKPFVVR